MGGVEREVSAGQSQERGGHGAHGLTQKELHEEVEFHLSSICCLRRHRRSAVLTLSLSDLRQDPHSELQNSMDCLLQTTWLNGKVAGMGFLWFWGAYFGRFY